MGAHLLCSPAFLLFSRVCFKPKLTFSFSRHTLVSPPATNAWVFFRISGGLFNPAVSLGLAIVGAITPLRALILTVAQILGGITGSALILTILPGSLNVRTTLAGGTSVAQGLFLEVSSISSAICAVRAARD